MPSRELSMGTCTWLSGCIRTTPSASLSGFGVTVAGVRKCAFSSSCRKKSRCLVELSAFNNSMAPTSIGLLIAFGCSISSSLYPYSLPALTLVWPGDCHITRGYN